MRAESCVSIALMFVESWASPIPRSVYAQERSGKIFAQQLIGNSRKSHPEVSGLETSTTPPGRHQCATIASTETKNLGEKCDKDEFVAMGTSKPFLEKEGDHFDATLPLRDVAGRLIGTVGIEFRPKPGQQKSEVVWLSEKIARELQEQIPAKSNLSERAK